MCCFRRCTCLDEELRPSLVLATQRRLIRASLARSASIPVEESNVAGSHGAGPRNGDDVQVATRATSKWRDEKSLMPIDVRPSSRSPARSPRLSSGPRLLFPARRCRVFCRPLFFVSNPCTANHRHPLVQMEVPMTTGARDLGPPLHVSHYKSNYRKTGKVSGCGPVWTFPCKQIDPR